MPQDSQDVNPDTLDPSASQTVPDAPPVERPPQSPPPEPPPTAPPKAEEPATGPESKPDFKAEVVKEIMEGSLDGDAPRKPAEPVADPKPEAPAPAPEKPKPHPFDDPDDPDGSNIAPQYTKIRADFDKLREKLRSSREEGQFGRMMVSAAQSGNLGPQDMARWVTLGSRLNRGDPAAVAELAALAQRVGIIPAPSAAPAARVKPPDDLVEKVYQEHFADDVKALDISEAKARQLAKNMAKALSQPTTPTAPPEQQTPPQQPQQTYQDPIQVAAEAELGRMDAQYQAAIQDYPAVRQAAIAAIAAKARAEGRPIPAPRWPVEFAQAIREAQQARVRPAAPVVRSTGVRPTSTLPDPRKVSKDDHNRAIARALASGGVDALP